MKISRLQGRSEACPGRAFLTLAELAKVQYVRVFVDGDQIRPDLVVTADDVAGEVVLLMTDDRGYRTHATKKIRGCVRFRGPLA